jgi:(4S)-4-hydroxy-5-phosphonooxypentane-2,3-dione isomerase
MAPLLSATVRGRRVMDPKLNAPQTTPKGEPVFHIVATFDVDRDRHQEFIAAALKDGRDSCANERGTRRFELIKDDADRFFLNEAYDDEAAFRVHESGQHYKRFFADIRGFAKENKDHPIRGTGIENASSAAEGVLRVFRIDEVCDQLLQTDGGDEFKPDHPENFVGDVRMIDLAGQAGLTGVEVVAVHFAADARTRPHVHPTEQLLYFVRGDGFVAFPGEEEQVVDEGGIVIVPACELHMHGATTARPTCHVAARLPSKTNWEPHVPAEWRRFVEGR